MARVQKSWTLGRRKPVMVESELDIGGGSTFPGEEYYALSMLLEFQDDDNTAEQDRCKTFSVLLSKEEIERIVARYNSLMAPPKTKRDLSTKAGGIWWRKLQDAKGEDNG